MKLVSLLLLLFVISVSITSCGNRPNNQILKKETRKGDWVYDQSVGKPVQSEETYYLLSPTWGQSFAISAKSGKYIMSVALGIIFLFGAVMVVYSQYANPSWTPKYFEKWWMVITFILVIVGLSFIYSKPSIIRFDNNKWVKKEIYDSVMTVDGNTKSIWNQFEKDGVIIGGPIKE